MWLFEFVVDVTIPTQVIKYNQNFLQADQPIRWQYSNLINLLIHIPLCRVSQVKYKYYEPLLLFIIKLVHLKAVCYISNIGNSKFVKCSIYEDRQKDVSMLKTSMLCLLCVFLYAIRCITCIAWNDKKKKIPHCHNNSKIKYQNRRKRQNHYT